MRQEGLQGERELGLERERGVWVGLTRARGEPQALGTAEERREGCPWNGRGSVAVKVRWEEPGKGSGAVSRLAPSGEDQLLTGQQQGWGAFQGLKSLVSGRPSSPPTRRRESRGAEQ